MASVDLTLPHHQYTVHIAPGLLNKFGRLVRGAAPHDRAALYVDKNVQEKFGPTASNSMTDEGYQLVTHAVEAGEDHKNLDAVKALYDVLLDNHLERKSPVLAMGGGVIGDTIGFVAATYLRGVPFVQCPTTLLAMVDASVGGKVGVNVPQGKNLVGAFHQPHVVVIDTDTLSTLPARELRCGLAECVKHGVIRSPEKFAWLEVNVDRVLALEPDALVELVTWNVQIKADVVMADEKEAGQRAHLNFGHTFAHAIEATQAYGAADGYHHGEAVSLGMVAATNLAVTAGRCEGEILDRLIALLDRIGLPTRSEQLVDNPTLLKTMQLDKKVADGRIRLVLPDGMGAVSIVNDTPTDEIAAAWDALR